MPGELVPFGKYKGQPVEALAADRGYLDWLTAQQWFRERYPGIYTVIINNFREPTETPEHNRLQVRFLDADFRRRVAHRLIDWPALAREQITYDQEVLGRHRAEWAQHQADLARRGTDHYDDWLTKRARDGAAAAATRIAELEANIMRLDSDIESVCAGGDFPNFQSRAKFEVGGWDVELMCAGLLLGSPPHGLSCFIELKPTLSDDYPAVLRQMKANSRGITATWGVRMALLIGECKAAGADLDQITEIFAASGFALLRLDECLAPSGRITAKPKGIAWPARSD